MVSRNIFLEIYLVVTMKIEQYAINLDDCMLMSKATYLDIKAYLLASFTQISIQENKW